MQSAAVLAAAAAAVLLLVAQGAAAQAPAYPDVDWVAGYGMACTGTAGKCAGVARRELGGGGYIGYDAMNRDHVPCSIRGAPYGNCNPSAAANPYNRGCQAIARCRG